jgi:hypothetical protein
MVHDRPPGDSMVPDFRGAEDRAAVDGCNLVLVGADQGRRRPVPLACGYVPRPKQELSARPSSLTQVARTCVQQGLRPPLLPERLRPFHAMVHLKDLIRLSTTALLIACQAQLALTWVVRTSRIALHVPQRIGRDLPRVVIAVTLRRQPQAGATRVRVYRVDG